MGTKHKADLIGKVVDIRRGFYRGHWGIIRYFDGVCFHVGGGSIGDDLNPVLDRCEFTVRTNQGAR